MDKVYFKNIRKEIKALLAEAKYDVKIAVAWFSDKSLILELERCIKRGVDVSIVFYDKSNDKELFKKLYEQNAKIATTSKLMHNKFCIIDDEIVINGSYNWTYTASKNHENIQVTFSKKTAVIFSKEYDNILNSPTTRYSEVENYFLNKEEVFQKYFEKQIQPKSFPILYKQQVTSHLKYELERFKNIRDLPFKHFYVYIENKDAYIKFHKKLSNQYGNENIFPHLLLASYIKSEAKDSSSLEFFVFDIIIDESIKSISQKDYEEGEPRFYSNKIFYLGDYIKENLLLIGFSDFNRTRNLKSYQLEVRQVRSHGFCFREKIGYLEYGGITINQNEILFGGAFAKVHIGDISYDYMETQTNYDIVIDKRNFEINTKKSNENKEIAISKKRSDQIKIFERLKQKREEKREKIRNSNDCYIATMVYKQTNHPNIIKLRTYRDNVLLNYKIGFLFVNIYYKISPLFVSYFKENKLVRSIAKYVIEKIIYIIEKKLKNNLTK